MLSRGITADIQCCDSAHGWILDRVLKNTGHLLLSLTLESISPSRKAAHAENSRLARHALAMVSKAQELHCVVLAPGSWSCWERSAGIAMPPP